MRMTRQITWSGRLSAALLISTGLGAALPSASALANDQVSLRLDWTIEGQHLPFIWAQDKGYYAAEGIDVKISEGRGSGNTAQLVGAKTDTFGTADASRAALARGQGAPLKVIAAYIQRSEGTVVSYASSGLNKPADLIGKKVATSQGSSSTVLFQAMLKASGVPESKIDLVSVDATAKVASLLQHRVDAVTGLMSAECLLVKEQSPGEKVTCMPVADFGVKALGVALIVNDDTIKDNPDLVRRFVRASHKGWTEAMKNPAEAAALAKKNFPLGDAKLLQGQFESVVSSLHSPDSVGHPIGWMAAGDWKDTVETLRSFMGLTSNAPATDYYTNDFIPEVEVERAAVAPLTLASTANGTVKDDTRPAADGRHQSRAVMIRIENVGKTFTTADGVVTALENVDLAIEQGQFVSIVGPSGCGKSTLLMCIAGLIETSKGSITVGSTRISGPFTQVGIVFQEALLLDWRTVLGNVLFQVEMRGPRSEGLRGPRPRVARTCRARRLRTEKPLGTVGRHAAARRHLPRPDPRSAAVVDGRTVRRARHADPRPDERRPAAAVRRDRKDRDLHHPQYRGGGVHERPGSRHDAAARQGHRRPAHRFPGSTASQSADDATVCRTRKPYLFDLPQHRGVAG